MPRGSAVSEMSPEEMRHALLISEKTGLPNRRAFHEGPFSSGANEAFVNFTLMMIALLALVCSAKALALLCGNISGFSRTSLPILAVKQIFAPSPFSVPDEDKKKTTPRPTARGRVPTFTSSAGWVTLVTLTLSLFSGQGCLLVPMRAPTRNSGASGEPLKGKVDLAFLQTGKTSGQDVREKLAWMNTGLGEKRFFLGRWSSSSSGTAWFVAGPPAEGAGGWNRNWRTRNILVDFDDKDLVKKYRVFPDSELVREFAERLAENPEPLDLSKPVKVYIRHRHGPGQYSHGTLLLGSDSFSYHEDGDKRNHDFEISPKEIKQFRLAGWRTSDNDAQNLDERVYFTRKTAVGGKMTICVRVADLMLLVRYWTQTQRS
jgi:hypothetical protein